MTRLSALFAAAAIALAPAAVSASPSPKGGGTPVPAAAAAAGYLTHSFGSSHFSTINVDKSLTFASGFQWYLWNFFGESTPSSAATLNPDGMMSVLGGFSNGTISSMAHIGSAPGYVGVAFGCGGYFTAELAFDPNSVDMSVGFPAWWSMAAEHLVGLAGEQWSGQASGYSHFIELDFFEFDRNPFVSPFSYGATLHDWYGISGSTCPPGYCNLASGFNAGTIAVPLATDWKLFHRIAELWVPATVSTDGYVQSYFDDIPIGPRRSWSQFTTQTPPVTGSSAWAFGIIDQQHLGLVLGSGSGALTIRSVDVWQGPGACNISN